MKTDIDKFAEELQEEILTEAKKEYTEQVMDHWMNPRHFGILNGPDGYGKITGPCGDTMEISFKVKDDRIAAMGFNTDGCGSSIVCASMTTELISGKNLDEARGVTQEVILEALGGLPDADKHCALLAADTLREAIRDYDSKKE
jgi:nitrogen fixation NifU-like protein